MGKIFELSTLVDSVCSTIVALSVSVYVSSSFSFLISFLGCVVFSVALSL